VVDVHARAHPDDDRAPGDLQLELETRLQTTTAVLGYPPGGGHREGDSGLGAGRDTNRRLGRQRMSDSQ
jgi:hypothetical protein